MQMLTSVYVNSAALAQSQHSIIMHPAGVGVLLYINAHTLDWYS